MSEPAASALEPLTEEQRAIVRQWQERDRVDCLQVGILRKKARGETLTGAERVFLNRPGRKPQGGGVPHEVVMRELADRQGRGS